MAWKAGPVQRRMEGGRGGEGTACLVKPSYREVESHSDQCFLVRMLLFTVAFTGKCHTEQWGITGHS